MQLKKVILEELPFAMSFEYTYTLLWHRHQVTGLWGQENPTKKS